MMLLDSDHLSILEWEDAPGARALLARITEHAPEEMGTTIINFEEQIRGWMSFLAASRKLKDQIEGYWRLKQQLKLYCKVEVLPFDERAAAEFQRLRKEHRRIGVMDLKIAAIALSNDATLLTRNLRDFSAIAGLKIDNWTR